MKLAVTGRFRALTAAPEFNLVVFALLLNLPWELLQAPLCLCRRGENWWVSPRWASRLRQSSSGWRRGATGPNPGSTRP